MGVDDKNIERTPASKESIEKLVENAFKTIEGLHIEIRKDVCALRIMRDRCQRFYLLFCNLELILNS